MHRVFLVLLIGLTVGSCRNPIRQAGDEADRAIARVDQSVAQALARVDQSVALARVEAHQTAKDLRTEYEGALINTSAEVSKLREEFKTDIDDLEGRLGERIDQMRIAALEVVSETDKATQARIDQVFTELRLFMKDTLDQIKALIEPVLTLATTLQGSVENGNEHIAKISEKIVQLVDQIQAILKEVKDVLHQVQGEESDGTPAPGTPTEVWAGLITAVVALVTSIFTRRQRAADQKKDGDRWKESELKNLTRLTVEEEIKKGFYDDYIKERMVAMGVLTVKPTTEIQDLERRANGGSK